MPCGAVVCGAKALCAVLVLSCIGVGVLTLTASFVVPDKISAEIKRRMEDSVQISTQSKFFDKFGKTDREAVVTVFNLTNAKAVQDGKEKPNFVPIKFGFDVHTERFDPDFVKGGSEVEYKSWSKYTVKAADKALYENGVLVVPNAQYIAGVHQRFGSESVMQLGLISFVVKKVGEAYTMAVPLLFQFSFLSVHMTGKFTQATWTTQYAANIPSSKQLTAAEASGLWSKLTAPKAQDTAHLIGWYSCAAPLAMKKANASEFSECVKAGTPGENIVALFSSDASLAGEKTGFLLTWLMTLLNDPAYLVSFKTKFVDAQAATNWADVGLLQFGSGKISQAMFSGKTTVDNLGILPKQLGGPPDLPLELPAFNAMLPALDISQARAFVDIFSVRANVTNFLMAMKAYDATKDPAHIVKIMPDYQKTGLSAQNAGLYFLYLTKHLVDRVLVHGLIQGNGQMDADGLYPSNSGMFCRLTPKQVLEGWKDPLISLIDSTPYYGILGEQFKSKEAKDAKKPGKFGMSTGVSSASGRITLWKGITKFHRRDELPEGSCTDGYTQDVRKDGSVCLAWPREEVIAGSGSGAFLTPFDGKITHRTYKSATTGSATTKLWNGDLFRNIEITRTGAVTSRDVRLEHFSLSEKTWLGDCSGNVSVGGVCNAANKNYSMSAGDAVYPLETVKKGIPMAVSMPYFLTPRGPRSDIRQCMNEASFPTTYKEEEHGMYWRFEPLTGAIAEGGSFRQVNLQMKSTTFDKLHTKVFTAMGCQDSWFPLAIAGAKKSISDSLRDDILYAYRVVVIGYAVSITCYVVSAICLLTAAILATVLLRQRAKGQQNAETETHASPEELPAVSNEMPVKLAGHELVGKMCTSV